MRSRVGTINGPLIDLIKPHVVEAEGRRGREDDPLVFLNKTGKRIRNSSFYTHQWTPSVQKAIGLGLTKSPRIHNMRHSSYKVTDDRYAHLLPDVDVQILVA